jgi:hypothetical protein
MTAPRRVKAGPITLACGLIIGGVVLLLANFGAISSLTWLWKLSPLLLVGIGAEYFLKRQLNRDPEIEVRFSIASLLLVIVLILVSGMVSTGGSFLGSLGQSYTRTWDSQPLEVKDGDQLVVENPFGRIDLTPASGTTLSVRALIRSPASGPAREQADQAVVDVEQIGNQIFVRVPSQSPLVALGSLSNISYDLEIKAPSKIDASLTSSAGVVTASDLQGNIDVRANAGKVELNGIGGNIAVQSETGLVQIVDPGCDVTSGIGSGILDLSSSHLLAGKYDLDDSTGKISFDIPAASDLTIKAVSDAGKISVSGFDAQKPLMNGIGSTFDATLGSGKGQASLQVDTGSIRIAAH